MRKGAIAAIVFGILVVLAGGSYIYVLLSQRAASPGGTATPTLVATSLAETASPAPPASPTPTVAAVSVTPDASTAVAPGATPTSAATQASVPTATATPSPPAPTVPATQVVAPPETVNVPQGFGVSVYVAGLAGPRMMTIGPDGQLYVAERGADRIIRLPDRNQDGVADGVEVVASGLAAPSSIAFYSDGSLYVGETARVLRITLGGDPPVAQSVDTIVSDLPSDGGHSTRTVLFSPDDQALYVSIGSSCNVCIENDPRRAAIVRYRPDGSDETIYATGLRNAVGMTFRPGTDELWVTNNGRDYLGNNEPPDTIYIVHQGDNAGWPYCHAGTIIDPQFGKPGSCQGVLSPTVDLQAHSAPLGLAFYTGTQFPADTQGSLFVAFHGSWNRTVPTGYKVVRIPIDNGTPGAVTDFATGWLRANGTHWGRPVDVVTGTDGSLLVSDDYGGRVYRIFYSGP